MVKKGGMMGKKPTPPNEVKNEINFSLLLTIITLSNLSSIVAIKSSSGAGSDTPTSFIPYM